MTDLMLTAQEKARIWEVLCDLDPRRRLPPDMRKTKRRGVLQWMWVSRLMKRGNVATHQRQVFRILARDVSAGGVGLFSRFPFERDDEFVLPVRFTEGGGKLFLCRVRFAQDISDRHFVVGAQFINSIEDPDGHMAIPPEWFGE